MQGSWDFRPLTVNRRPCQCVVAIHAGVHDMQYICMQV